MGRAKVTGIWRSCSHCITLILLAAALPAQDSKSPDLPPDELVRITVKNELKAADDKAPKHMFLSRKQTPKGSQTKLYVETNSALAAMLVAVNDKPLTTQQIQAEKDHLAWLEGSPDQLRKKHAREKEDEERTLRIVKALPDAFLYTYAGTETATPELGKVGDPLVRLKFSPNPSYQPPSRVEQVLEGMEGYLLIDAAAQRIARIDGTLFRDVSFGWGIIGHLDKGGHFRVQQADVGEGLWDITALELKMSGKILLFKSISMISNETFSEFHRVPDDLPFAKGVELLQSEEKKLPPNLGERSEGGKPPR